MYSTSKRIIALILLGSHLLTTIGCSGNPNIPTKQEIAHVNRKVDKKRNKDNALVLPLTNEGSEKGASVGQPLTNELTLVGSNSETLPSQLAYLQALAPATEGKSLSVRPSKTLKKNKEQSLVFNQTKTLVTPINSPKLASHTRDSVKRTTPIFGLQTDMVASKARSTEQQTIERTHLVSLDKSKGLDSYREQAQGKVKRAGGPEGIVLNVNTPAPERTIIEHSFTAKGGHQIQLKKQDDSWIAIVKENAPTGFSRTLYLALYLAPGVTLNELSKHATKWQQAHIAVIFPEEGRNKKGYVYIGSTGLLGGGNGNSKPVYEYKVREQCNKCRKVLAGEYVRCDYAPWENIPLYPIRFYTCSSCKDAEQAEQARKEREQREREEALRREQERVREEQRRREEERREKEERYRAQELLRKNERERIEKELRKVTEDKNKIECLSAGLNRARSNNEKLRTGLNQLEHTTREHKHLAGLLLHKYQLNQTLAQHIKNTYAISEVLEEEFVQVQRSLRELTDQREKIQNKLDAQRIAIQAKEENIQGIDTKLKHLQAQKEIAISRYKREKENIEQEEEAVSRRRDSYFSKRYADASSVGKEEAKEAYTIDQIEAEMQALQVTFAQEQQSLNQQQEAASNLTEAFKKQLQKEEQSKEALEGLEKELAGVQEANQKLSLLAEKFNQAVSNQKQVENLAELAKEAWYATQRLEETLIASQQSNEVLYKQIRQTYSKQKRLPEMVFPFYHKVAELSQQRQEAQSENIQINASIKQREEPIQKIEQALKNLKTVQDIKQAELLEQGSTYSEGDRTAATQEEIEAINQRIQAMQERLDTEESKLQQQQLEAKHLQEILGEQIEQTEKQKELLIQVQHELDRNQEIEAEVEALIDEDLKQSLEQSIAADQRMEEFLRRLRTEEQLMKEHGLSSQVAEELANHVELEEERLYTEHIKKREAEQAWLAAESVDLRNAYSTRQAELEKKLQELAEEEIADEAAYEESTREWALNNQRECQQEAQQL